MDALLTESMYQFHALEPQGVSISLPCSLLRAVSIARHAMRQKGDWPQIGHDKPCYGAFRKSL
jgi:hypothetical protein